MVRSSVDLPAPEGPMMAVTLPAGRLRSIPSSTFREPKLLEMPWMRTVAAGCEEPLRHGSRCRA